MPSDSAKIPFSVYDFFGYLASGFLVLAAADYAYDAAWFLKKDLGLAFGVFWAVAAYITGHIIANLSSYLLEKQFVRAVLGSPEETLFEAKKTTGLARLFPGFYEPLPGETQERILQKAKAKAGINKPGRSLFYHCHPIVKRQQVTLERLNTFLNLYGFCRNISMAALLAIPVLLIGAYLDWRAGTHAPGAKLWLAGAAAVVSVGMLYRYLKFFRHYTIEVFITYAEIE
jgi:hypothetical protein